MVLAMEAADVVITPILAVILLTAFPGAVSQRSTATLTVPIVTVRRGRSAYGRTRGAR